MEELVKQAVRELNLDVPVMGWEVEDGRVRLRLYGGGEVEWQAVKVPEPRPETGKTASQPVRKSSSRAQKQGK